MNNVLKLKKSATGAHNDRKAIEVTAEPSVIVLLLLLEFHEHEQYVKSHFKFLTKNIRSRKRQTETRRQNSLTEYITNLVNWEMSR